MWVFNKENIAQLTDDELVKKYKESGNAQLLGELYKRYSKLVYGLCLKYFKNTDESQDAVLRIFEKLMTDLKNHEVQYFKSWLFMVSKNFCLMELRKKQVKVRRMDEYEAYAQSSHEPEPFANNAEEKAWAKEEKIEQLELALSQLKNEQKTCVELFYLQEKSYNEISDITGYDLKKVKSFIQNGKRNLELYLTGKKEIKLGS
jgi:RNA polymerase sigma factor (sigma-70 family)